MAIDLFTLSATADPTRFTWAPAPLLLTPANTLQGGAGLGAAVTAMETVTGRPLIWATGQYLSFATGTEPLDLDVTVEVAGHNTTQARCVVSRGGVEVLTAHGALGHREFDHDGVWCERPVVPAPEDCPPFGSFSDTGGGMRQFVEMRLARGRQIMELDATTPPGDGWLAVWFRCWQGRAPVRVADLTFIGDFMPMGFAQAIGGPYAGNSLDNTIRVGELVETEWVLLSIHVSQIAHGFGYGRAELWAQDGSLLGEVSQTSVIRSHDRLASKKR